jgi:hypothetical protein
MTAPSGALRLTAYRQIVCPAVRAAYSSRPRQRLIVTCRGDILCTWLPASAKCSRTERCLTRGPPRSSRKAALSGLRSSAVETPLGPAPHRPLSRVVTAGEDARTCRPAMYRPGGGRNSELAAEYPDAFTMLALPLLHDFPEPGNFPSQGVQVPPRTQILVRFPLIHALLEHARWAAGHHGRPAPRLYRRLLCGRQP